MPHNSGVVKIRSDVKPDFYLIVLRVVKFMLLKITEKKSCLASYNLIAKQLRLVRI